MDDDAVPSPAAPLAFAVDPEAQLIDLFTHQGDWGEQCEGGKVKAEARKSKGKRTSTKEAVAWMKSDKWKGKK